MNVKNQSAPMRAKAKLLSLSPWALHLITVQFVPVHRVQPTSNISKSTYITYRHFARSFQFRARDLP